jgi:CcmD family protein
MRSIRIVLLALVALLAAVPALHAQAPAGEAATEAAAASSSGAPASPEAAAPAADAAAQTTSVPRYTPPRTMRSYTHVFASFAIAWVLLFGYLVFIARKFRRVEEQVNALARS